MTIVRQKIVVLLVILFISIISSGCADIFRLFLPRTLPLPVNIPTKYGRQLTKIEEFYFSGKPYDCIMPGVRVIKNVKNETAKSPAIQRMIFTKTQWYDLFFSESETAQEFLDYIKKLNNQEMNKRHKKDEPFYFDHDLFYEFNDEIRYKTTQISFYKDNLLVYSLPEEKILLLLFIPNFHYNDIKTMAYSELK